MQVEPVARRRRFVAAILLAVAVTVALAACGNNDPRSASNGRNLGSGSSASAADIAITKEGFTPRDLKMKANEDVSFVVANTDSRDHSFTLPVLDIDTPIAAGQRATITIKATEAPRDGLYSFYSKGEQKNGYYGTIKVEN